MSSHPPEPEHAAIDPAIADLQAQIVALRLAIEGAWLSMLSPAADPAAEARRLGEQNIAAIGRMDVTAPGAQVVRDAVVHHTKQLWGSIAWQLDEAARRR